MKEWKRWISGILSVVLVFSCLGVCLPVWARALPAQEYYKNTYDDASAAADWTGTGFQVKDGKLLVESTGGALCYVTPDTIPGGDYVISGTASVAALDMKNGTSAGLVFRLRDSKNFLHFRLNASNTDGKAAQLYGCYNGSMQKLAEFPMEWRAGETYTLKVAAQGNNLTCYVNGNPVITHGEVAYDPSIVGRGVGYRIWGAKASFDDLMVQSIPEEPVVLPKVEISQPGEASVFPEGVPEIQVTGKTTDADSATISVNGNTPEPLPLAEDGSFVYTLTQPSRGSYHIQVTAYRGEAKAEAAVGFRVAARMEKLSYTFEDGSLEGWYGDTESFSIVAGENSQVLQGYGNPALLLAPELPQSDSYRVSGEVAITDGGYTCAGLVFRYQDGENYLYLRLEGQGNVALWLCREGSWKSLQTAAAHWKVGTAVKLEAQVDGNFITCYADGRELFSLEDTGYVEPQTPGQVGIRLVKASAQLDNLTVDEVTGPAPATVEVPERVEKMPMEIRGTASGASRVEITVQDAEGKTVRNLTAPVAAGEYTAETFLPSGTYRIQVVAVSLGGNGYGAPALSDFFRVELPEQPLEVVLQKNVEVPVAGPVVLAFSAPVEESTLSGIVLRDASGKTVAARAELDEKDPDGKRVFLIPEENLAFSTPYEVEIPKTVLDVTGNSCAQTVKLPFTTQKDINQLKPLETPQGEVTLSLNGQWDFTPDPQKIGEAQKWYETTDFSQWDKLAVPGNWDLENAYANYRGTGWYSRSFHVDESYAGYPAYLDLTAVYHDCRIFVNGQLVGSHDGGYTTFQLRVDEYLKYGEENRIFIAVNNEFSYGAWWKWGGISGDALLRIYNAPKLDYQHISSEVDLENHTAALHFQYQITNHSTVDKTYHLVSQVYDKATGAMVGEVTTQVTVKPQAVEQEQKFTADPLILENPKLWDTDNPNLYIVKTWLKDGEQVLHYAQDQIGIRKIEIKDTRFYLNGEQMRLTGANRVWDDRVVGQTEPDYVIMRDIDYMKSMGMNCARLSHVPMSKNLLDYCDEVGFLLICEGNLWGGGGVAQVKNPEGSQYPYRVVPWYKEMIQRDYNHPSIFAWSIGNELSGNQQIVKDYAKFMVSYIKTELDSTRYVTEVSLSAHRPNNPDNPMGDSVYYSDFICCNYYGGFRGNVEKIHNTYPDKAIFVSEYGNGQTSEIPDKSDINPKNILDQWGDLDYVFGASIWTLNDYRSCYPGTPLGQNRVWGVTTVWGEKKLGFESLRKAASPVKNLQISLSGDTDALLVLGVQSRDGTRELPAYTLSGAKLKWEAWTPQGEQIASGLVDIPALAPDGSLWKTSAAVEGLPDIGMIRATVIDSLGYEIAETFRYLQAPVNAPEITQVISTDNDVRVLFRGVPQAERYLITLEGNGVSKTVTAMLNHYADFTDLPVAEGYTVTVQAENAAGKGAVSTPVSVEFTPEQTTLPPVIWHTEPISGGFMVGYSVKSESDTYELQYGTQSGSYTHTMTLTTQGAAKVSGLTGGTTYYYRLRSITDGIPSQWSEEVAVTVENAQPVRQTPLVKGAAGGENAVSLTISPSWKASGYTVKYGKSPDALNQSVYIHRGMVEQLMISGLETDETYYFSVAAHNGSVMSEFSQPVSAVTKSQEAGEVVIGSVKTDHVSLNQIHNQGEIVLTAAGTCQEEKTITVEVGQVPEGITISGYRSFTLAPGGEAVFTLPVELSSTAKAGNYLVEITLLEETRVLAHKWVKLTVCDTQVLLEETYSQPVDYVQSGSGGSGTVVDGVFRITNTSGSGAPIFTVKDLVVENCTLEADITLTSKENSVSGISGGLVFRYQDDKNFCHARIDLSKDAAAPSFQVYRWTEGKAVMLYSQVLSQAWNATSRIRVVDQGGLTKFYLNDVFMTELDLGSGGGKIGYRVYAANAGLDNLRVYRTTCPGIQHTVTFQTMGGSEIPAVLVNSGEPLTRPEDPVRSGYVFAGWYQDSRLTQRYDFNQGVTEDMTLYAKWEAAHVHEAREVPAKAATCTQDGNIGYWHCSDCGKYFADADCTQEITLEDTVVKAKGHNYEDGVCTVCGEKDPNWTEPTEPTQPSEPAEPTNPSQPETTVPPTDPEGPDQTGEGLGAVWLMALTLLSAVCLTAAVWKRQKEKSA